MCLRRITKTYVAKRDLKKTVRAFKIVDEFGKSCFREEPVPFIWKVDDFLSKLEADQGGQYPAGWHAYRYRKQAEAALAILQDARYCTVPERRSGWVVVPVLLRGVHTLGIDGASSANPYVKLAPRTLVAGEIKRVAK